MQTSSLTKSKTPILIIAFNRPATLKKCLEKLKDSSEGKLYFAVDGPRNKDESALVDETLRVIKNLQWPNKIHLRHSNENKGCHKWVSSSISWFFEREEFGIILEEDILLDSRFFAWCEQARGLRENNNRIMHINAFSPDSKFCEKPHPHFSKYCTSWGWATWSDSWKNYSDDMHALFCVNPIKRLMLLNEKISCGWMVAIYYFLALKMTQQGKLSSWAYRWNYSVWISNGLSISPGFNLSQNIGVGIGASHTSKETHLAEFLPATLDIKIPLDIQELNEGLDRTTFNSIMLCNSWARIVRMAISVITPNSIFFFIRKKFR